MSIQIVSSGSRGPFTTYDIARGERACHGIVHVNKYGLNPDVGAGTTEDIWQTGGTRNYLTAAETMDVFSDDADDTLLGNGARTLYLQGLDADWNLAEETIDMDGAGVVVTANSYLRIIRAYVATAGSSGTNEGSIRIDPTVTGIGSRQASIAIGNGQTLLTHYTIPAGYTGYLIDAQVSAGIAAGAGTKEIRAQLWKRENPDADGAWRLQRRITVRSHTIVGASFGVPEVFPEKTDIKWTAWAESNNTYAYAEYTLLLDGRPAGA